ncbi:pseudouridylate synthase 3 [Aspergillus unguis]
MSGNTGGSDAVSGATEIQNGKQQQQPDYSTWSNTSLIERITELERQLHSRTVEYTSPPTPLTKTQELPPAPAQEKAASHSTKQEKQEPRKMNPANYNYRHIALKFAYLGQRYNGLEHANGNITPLPTVEEELWKALRRTRLISPTDMEEEPFDARGQRKSTEPFTLSWEGCDYSKAGRTDRGVSAFGQVVGIKVRSARPKRKELEPIQGEDEVTDSAAKSEAMALDDEWDDIANELPYIGLLNKALPEDIRILAWCPHLPEDFNARFSCRGRHYKYFFTQPAFSPTPGPLGFLHQGGNERPKFREGWLDIDAMREAAKYFEGVHDFRNFCKVDTSKQIENFQRIIYKADIELLDPRSNPLGYVNRPDFQALEHPVEHDPAEIQTSGPPGSQVYVFDLQGSAFLWHQVRHMVGILFLVGQGLEPPSVVRDLLDVSKHPRKPMYEMASDAPLVLWDCFFPEQNADPRDDALEWVYAGDARQTKSAFLKGGGKFGVGGVVDDLWSVWRQRKIDEVLAGSLLDLVLQQGDQSDFQEKNMKDFEKEKQKKMPRVFQGANEGKANGKYVPLMQKRKMETVEVQNARWLAAKQRRIEKGPQTDAQT